jgi:phosphatidylserine/phosphatidylglycerophosphate/cardiolipin synthase-like enzyme
MPCTSGFARDHGGMRKAHLLIVATVCLVACLTLAKAPLPDRPAPAAAEAGIEVFFSPKGGCQDAIVAAIKGAKTSIDVQAYHLTSTAIAAALNEAHKRGVKVRAVLDKDAAGEKYSGATYLANAGIETYMDGEHSIAHNKVIIIDSGTVITFSYNFSKAAEERNAENLLVIRERQTIATAYVENFEAHLKHAERYAGILPSPSDN